jgi:hypothetical protein
VVVLKNIPVRYDIRQYKLGRGPEIIPGINLPSTNTRFIPASYQAKISIQPNTKDQTGMKLFKRNPD